MPKNNNSKNSALKTKQKPRPTRKFPDIDFWGISLEILESLQFTS